MLNCKNSTRHFDNLIDIFLAENNFFIKIPKQEDAIIIIFKFNYVGIVLWFRLTYQITFVNNRHFRNFNDFVKP